MLSVWPDYFDPPAAQQVFKEKYVFLLVYLLYTSATKSAVSTWRASPPQSLCVFQNAHGVIDSANSCNLFVWGDPMKPLRLNVNNPIRAVTSVPSQFFQG